MDSFIPLSIHLSSLANKFTYSRVLMWGVGPPVKCHLFIERLFCLPNPPAALNSINYISLFMPECVVLSMDKFLPQCVGRFEVNQDKIFIKHLPEFLRCSCDIQDDGVRFFHLLLSVSSRSLKGFEKGPVWIDTCLKCSSEDTWVNIRIREVKAFPKHVNAVDSNIRGIHC